jgi:hypothetical protein
MITRAVVPTFAVPPVENQRCSRSLPSSCESRVSGRRAGAPLERGRPRSMLRRQKFLRWQRDVHVYAHWYRRQHDLSRITLSDSHVPDVGEHGERNRAMFVKILDLVGVCVNRIGKG